MMKPGTEQQAKPTLYTKRSRIRAVYDREYYFLRLNTNTIGSVAVAQPAYSRSLCCVSGSQRTV